VTEEAQPEVVRGRWWTVPALLVVFTVAAVAAVPFLGRAMWDDV
jgi:hypothetical protein